MKCPICKTPDSKVIDSRSSQDGFVIRRRRACENCHTRFTSYERVEKTPWKVIKKDGALEDYDREKIMRGILTACEKRPVKLSQIEDIVTDIDNQLEENYKREVETKEIGELVMQQLQKLDEVAYIRFASVYRQFKDINHLLEEVNNLLQK